jgi:hemerythrin-like domain-containing protein
MAVAHKKQTLDAAEMLRQDHQKVKDLFRKYSELGEGALKSKERLAEQIMRELEVHTRLEEEIFYPRARQARQDLEDVVAEGFEEHHVADLLMEEIRGLQPSDETFDAKMKVLCENIQHHIEEEETELLPEAERALRDQMETITEQMQQMKQRLMASG